MWEDVPWRALRELFVGGLANATSSSLLNWSDVVKVRLQTEQGGAVMYGSFRKGVTRIVAEEGLIAPWGGLLLPGIFPSLLREFGYSSLRFGLYPSSRRVWCGDLPAEEVKLWHKLGAGLTTGAVGSALASPTDLVKMRFQKEAGRVEGGVYVSGLHKGQPPSYPSTLAAFRTIYLEEGIKNGLYKGVSMTIFRAAFLAAGQLATYDHTKTLCLRRSLLVDGPLLHVAASLSAAVAAVAMCQPFDTIKTRYMTDAARGQRLYSSSLDCFLKTIRAEGLRGLYIGTVASYARVGPHFIISLPLWEQLRKAAGLGYLK